MVALELHELPPLSLYSYHHAIAASSQSMQRMLAMIPSLLQQTLSNPGQSAVAAPADHFALGPKALDQVE
jgi:hypothetical protein